MGSDEVPGVKMCVCVCVCAGECVKSLKLSLSGAAKEPK